MKTDLQLQRDVVDELRFEPRVNDAEIAVSAKGGVATLAGAVSSYAQKRAAQRAAERVSGVHAVADDLAVKLPGDLTRTDTEIAHAAVTTMSWDAEVPADRIKVRVENGFITLDGTTEWNFQKTAAERAVRYLSGVRGVYNAIVVSPKVSATDVKAKVESALKRSAELDAQRITVEAADGTVTLKGRVRSWIERQDAERAAWAAPGVKMVHDQLLVSA